jgi:hypothetical protein
MDMDVENNTRIKPFWVPPGVNLEDVPEGLQAVIEGVLSPAYVQLVVGAQPGVEQSTGVTIAGLLWLECIEYFQLGLHTTCEDATSEQEKKEKSMASLLRVTSAKLKASDFLLRLQEARRRWAKESGLPCPPMDGVDGFGE